MESKQSYGTVSGRVDADRLAVFLGVKAMCIDVTTTVPRPSTRSSRSVKQPLDLVLTAHVRLLRHRTLCYSSNISDHSGLCKVHV